MGPEPELPGDPDPETRENGLLRCFAAAVLVIGLANSGLAADLHAGIQHLAEQRWQEARAVFDRILEEDASETDARALRGVCRYHLDQPEAALEDLTAALADGTQYVSRALYYKGLCFSRQGNAREAEKTFAQLIMQHPGSVEARRLGVGREDVPHAVRARRGFDVRGSSVTVEIGYDSNVDQTANGEPDAFAEIYASSDLAVQEWPVTFGGSLFLEKYASETDLDYLNLTLHMAKETMLSSGDALEGILQLDRSWLGSSDYQMSVGFLAGHSRAWNALWDSEARAGFILDSALDDEEESEDANGLFFRLRAWRRITGTRTLSRDRWVAMGAIARVCASQSAMRTPAR